jgi:hypothetical protein
VFLLYCFDSIQSCYMKASLLQLLFAILILLVSSSPSHGAPTTTIPATPGEIKGLRAVCPGSLTAYSIDPVAQALYYTWAVPVGWMIVSGQGGTQLYVAPGANGGTISVRAENQYGVSGARKLDVGIQEAPSQPEVIVGPADLCAGGKVIYQVQSVRADVSYMWSIPAGWVLLAGQGTGEIEVMRVAGEGIVYVASRNQCGYSTEASLAVTVLSPISRNLAGNSQKVCAGEMPMLLEGSTPAGGNGTYVYLWESSTQNASEGFAPAVGVNNNQHYTPGLLTATTWFRRKVVSGDCEHTSESSQINVLPVPDKPSVAQLNDTLLQANIQGEYYEWRRNGELLASHGQYLYFDAAGGYDVRVRQGDCFSPYSDVLNVVLAEESIRPDVIMSLQPGRGQLIISAKEPLFKVELLLFNLQGREVYRKKLEQLNKPIALELGQLPDGVYILSLQTPELYLKQKVLLQR